MNALVLLEAHLQIGRQAFLLNPQLTRTLRQEIAAWSHPPLPETAWKRIGFYVLQAQITGLWVTTLRGSGFSQREKNGLARLGALTPLVDDWTDEQHLSATDILERLHRGAGVVSQLYRQLFEGATDAFKFSFERALHAQEESLAQFNHAPLSADRLREISFRKGATAMVWYRHYFDNPLLAGEQEVFEWLGYALQLTNDLFDLYKDREAGQQTLVTNTRDMASVAGLFAEAVQQVRSKLFDLPYEVARLRKTWALIGTVLSRGGVCLDQLQRLQQHTGHFDPAVFTRAQLICDMEKTRNVLAAWQHARRWMKAA